MRSASGGVSVILSMQGQAFIFLAAVITGFLCGFIFDAFRILRRIFRHGSVLTQIEDIIFWVLAALIVFYMMFITNSGELRGFGILGVFLGMVLYFASISRLVISCANKIIEMIKKVLRKAWKSFIMKIHSAKNAIAKLLPKKQTKAENTGE